MHIGGISMNRMPVPSHIRISARIAWNDRIGATKPECSDSVADQTTDRPCQQMPASRAAHGCRGTVAARLMRAASDLSGAQRIANEKRVKIDNWCVSMDVYLFNPFKEIFD